jgi:hypothetical protein
MSRQFGGGWLGYELRQRLELIPFLAEQLAMGRENIPWPTMSIVLVLARWCDPSSELHLAVAETMRHRALMSRPCEGRAMLTHRPMVKI